MSTKNTNTVSIPAVTVIKLFNHVFDTVKHNVDTLVKFVADNTEHFLFRSLAADIDAGHPSLIQHHCISQWLSCMQDSSTSYLHYIYQAYDYVCVAYTGADYELIKIHDGQYHSRGSFLHELIEGVMHLHTVTHIDHDIDMESAIKHFDPKILDNMEIDLPASITCDAEIFLREAYILDLIVGDLREQLKSTGAISEIPSQTEVAHFRASADIVDLQSTVKGTNIDCSGVFAYAKSVSDECPHFMRYMMNSYAGELENPSLLEILYYKCDLPAGRKRTGKFNIRHFDASLVYAQRHLSVPEDQIDKFRAFCKTLIAFCSINLGLDDETYTEPDLVAAVRVFSRATSL